MHIVYSREDPPQSFSKAIFLAGPTPRPTPRSRAVKSWRPDTLRLLKEYTYDGVVFVPESRNGRWHRKNYKAQIEWEERSLHMADCIMFWVPRNLKNMPAFTTNIEWGVWHDSGKVVFGAPYKAEKMEYFRYYADKLFVPHFRTLEDTVRGALDCVGEGALREHGEREVPLYIWETPHFQQWYEAQKKVGNRLDHARVAWTSRVGPRKKIIFTWALYVDVFIAREGRNKISDPVISRPDIGAIMLYRKDPVLDNSDIILVREFRSPVTTEDGFVWELPSGSSRVPVSDFREVAVHECDEEVGFSIDADRLKRHEIRQLAATFSSHKAHLFSAEITEEELKHLKTLEGVARGVPHDSEQTYVHIAKLKDIKAQPQVDWSMLGMILSVLG